VGAGAGRAARALSREAKHTARAHRSSGMERRLCTRVCVPPVPVRAAPRPCRLFKKVNPANGLEGEGEGEGRGRKKKWDEKEKRGEREEEGSVWVE
jgi:hypothetical protein